jgi:hypothetical protein
MSKRIADKDPTLVDDPKFQRLMAAAAGAAEPSTIRSLSTPRNLAAEAARAIQTPVDRMAAAIDENSAKETERFESSRRLEWAIVILAAVAAVAAVVTLITGRESVVSRPARGWIAASIGRFAALGRRQDG